MDSRFTSSTVKFSEEEQFTTTASRAHRLAVELSCGLRARALLHPALPSSLHLLTPCCGEGAAMVAADGTVMAEWEVELLGAPTDGRWKCNTCGQPTHWALPTSVTVGGGLSAEAEEEQAQVLEAWFEAFYDPLDRRLAAVELQEYLELLLRRFRRRARDEEPQALAYELITRGTL